MSSYSWNSYNTRTHMQYISFTVFLVQLRLLDLVYYIISIKTMNV